jgi:hypothetical protein
MKTPSAGFALVLLPALLSAFLPAPAFAQDEGLGGGPRGASVFLEASAASLGQGAGVIWGGSGGGYIQGHVLGFVARVTALPANYNLHAYSAVVGPRLAVSLPLFRVFLEAGGGMGRVDNYNTAGSPGSAWGAAWQADAGISHGILPRVDWRILDVAYGRIDAGSGVYPVVASTGLTLHIW